VIKFYLTFGNHYVISLMKLTKAVNLITGY